MNNVMILASGLSGRTVDTAGGWNRLSGAITSGWSGLFTAAAIIGVALIVFALVKWAWERRRGGGMGNSGPMWGALLPGFILIAPLLLIPLVLNLFDFIANIAVQVFRAATGG